jgi:Xaa-Pro aminopeptidase
MLQGIDLENVRSVLRHEKLDGWLLYDFRGVNAIAQRIIGVPGMATRRLFVLLPARGEPVALAHKIELGGMKAFPGRVIPYAGWHELHDTLGSLVRNRSLAMEIYAADGVPYLDRVPAGVVDLLVKLGATLTSSAGLVSRFAARWSAQELAGHRKSAEAIAQIAKSVMADVVKAAGTAREATIQRRILEMFDRQSLVTNDPPIVAFGANAANPHYEPKEGSDALLRENQVVLIDLWAGPALPSVFADQTWMGCAGSAPPADVVKVWETVRDARDAVVDHLTTASNAGRTVTGADLDDAARNLITERGFGDFFIHRTGHSIDLELHGSGPHLDNFETHDTRTLIPGVGFSVEPGVYLEGNFGVRSEINGVMLANGKPEFTPREAQRDLILP